MGALKKYDPKKVTATWGDISLNEGIVDGSFFVIDRTERNSSMNTGADGGSTMVIRNNRSGTFTATYRAGSKTNKLLQAQLEIDEADSDDKKVAPLEVKDFGGESEAFSAEVFLDGPPTLEYSTEEGENVWTFMCHELKITPGASNRAAPVAGSVGNI